MRLFDDYIKKVSFILKPWISVAYSETGEDWMNRLQNQNTYIMEKDKALELGGYPKESINLIAGTSQELPIHGIHRISGKIDNKKQISFGKVVLLRSEGVSDSDVYEFCQNVLIADVRFWLKDVMLRSSSQRYLLNFRVGRKAVESGFNDEIMARTIHKYFSQIPNVKEVAVILIYGDHPVYKDLLPIAEDVKHVSSALNTIFNGLEMNCGSCNLNEICKEVEGLRELHQQMKS
jgi:hypothetical protein